MRTSASQKKNPGQEAEQPEPYAQTSYGRKHTSDVHVVVDSGRLHRAHRLHAKALYGKGVGALKGPVSIHSLPTAGLPQDVSDGVPFAPGLPRVVRRDSPFPTSKAPPCPAKRVTLSPDAL